MNYYNEIDAFAAAWLRALIAADQIANGHVDERDIREVTPDDLRGYRQCHFFAGIGGWSYALRLAGWADDTPAWTGSCPCQPFSAAGKGQGEADERHLWPEFARLIRQCRPAVVFGEQVEAAIRHGWLDLVQADLEREGYAVGTAVLPAAGVGAPHPRHRLFFVAESNQQHGDDRRHGSSHVCGQRSGEAELRGGQSVLCRMADALPAGRAKGRAFAGDGSAPRSGEPHLLGDPGSAGLARRSRQSPDNGEEQPTPERAGGATDLLDDAGSVRRQARRLYDAQYERLQSAAEGSAGFWSDCDWLPCRDGKARPIESGTFPLAHGLPARVGRLRGYGNAIVAPLAAEFIRAYLETRQAAP